jgi:hypothetical protein
MTGDFSRLTFDSRKHYTRVRMQQGRMQLDADWNEQADIVQYYLETQLHDLLGSDAGPEHGAGFALTVSANACWIGAGRYYVDGTLCENHERIRLTQQPDYASAWWPSEAADDIRYLAYLDVWPRNITWLEDPDLREVALGGLDTTTRTKTVWQVRLLKLSAAQAQELEEHAHNPKLRSDKCKAFIPQHGPKGRLRARRIATVQPLTNQLYRVEVHSVDGQSATIKWSRENGAVAFPITDISTAADGKACVVTLGEFGRDLQSLQAGNWAEIVDDDAALSDAMPRALTQIESPNLLRSQVTLNAQPPLADSEQQQRILTRHPALRRWEGVLTIGLAAGPKWIDLERGIQVQFTGGGTYRRGDYWLIPARAANGQIEWPPDPAGQPQEQLPHGIYHHYSPLALLHRSDGQWTVADLRQVFDPLPVISRRTRRELKEAEIDLDHLEARVAKLEAEIKALKEEPLPVARPMGLFQDLRSSAPLQVGDVVSLDLAKENHVVQADEDNEALVVGVIAASEHHDEHEHHEVRVAVYGRARCRVIGRIQPGDLLVPSQIKGCARAAGIYLKPGTIIGKALGAYQPDDNDEAGTIPVLVTLG